MNNLLLIDETFTNGFTAVALDVTFFASILSSMLVIISKNPIVSVLFLIALFFSVASYLLLLGINFIGLSYLLVYVGAVSILFLFILMLINIRISELFSDTSNNIPLAFIITVSISYPFYHILSYHFLDFHNYNVYLMYNFSLLNKYISDNFYTIFKNSDIYFSKNKDILAYVTSKIWDGSLAEMTHITSIGNIMYTSYSIWLIITSIILLLAMVGAIVITIKQKLK